MNRQTFHILMSWEIPYVHDGLSFPRFCKFYFLVFILFYYFRAHVLMFSRTTAFILCGMLLIEFQGCAFYSV